MLSTNATETYLGTFLSGFAAGGSINLVILFVAELADNKLTNEMIISMWTFKISYCLQQDSRTAWNNTTSFD